jgi:hypothetical protein
MDILALVPKTPNKLVPHELILPTTQLKLPSLQIQENPQKKISRKKMLPLLPNLLRSYPSFIALFSFTSLPTLS